MMRLRVTLLGAGASGVRVELLETSVNDWQELVHVQRATAALTTPVQPLRAHTQVQHTDGKWLLSLGFDDPAEDTLWAFANSLMLRLRSAGVTAAVLLKPKVTVMLKESVEQPQDAPWGGEIEWHCVVVESGRRELQRVLLPCWKTASDDEAWEEPFPRLTAFVDDMLARNRASRRPIAVILRGLPGSGKTTLGKELERLCQPRGVDFVVCSTNFYFATPRGYAFDHTKLKDYHSRCQNAFARALDTGTPGMAGQQRVVVVDNTNTQAWEYRPYEALARSRADVHLIEIPCPDEATAQHMGRRSEHGVPPKDVARMFSRWEKDSRAVCFAPQLKVAGQTLLILCFDSEEMMGVFNVADTLLLRTQLQEHMGGLLNSRRRLLVQISRSSRSLSSSATLRRVRSMFMLPTNFYFDGLETVQADAWGQGLQEINEYRAVTVLTTVQDSARWPFGKALSGGTVNTIRVKDRSLCSDMLMPSFTIMDKLGLHTQELARRSTLIGIKLVTAAWAHVRASDMAAAESDVQRIDSTVAGMNSQVVELCIILPAANYKPSDIWKLQEELAHRIQQTSGVQQLADTCIDGPFYFTLRCEENVSRVFSVQVVASSGDGETKAEFLQLKLCKALQQASTGCCDIEVFSVLTDVLREMIWRRCADKLLPSRCLLSSLVNLTAESLVVAYLRHLNSKGRRVTVADAGGVLFAVYDMLLFLHGDVLSALGDSLFALQGDANARMLWGQALKSCVACFKNVLDTYLVRGDLWNSFQSLDHAAHLGILVALMSGNGVTDKLATITGNAPAQPYLDFTSQCLWSVPHVYVLCDILKATAAAYIPRHDGRVFFTCAPSLLRCRIDITSSTLDTAFTICSGALTDVAGKKWCYDLPEVRSAFSNGFVLRQENDKEWATIKE